MKITSAFKGEHGLFNELMEKTLEAVSRGEPYEGFKARLALLADAIRSHIRLEEECLFMAIHWNEDVQQGPSMLMHDLLGHTEILRAFREAQAETDYDTAYQTFLKIVEETRKHFAEEERNFFSIAEMQLGEAKLHALGMEWARQRKVWIAAP